MFNAGDFTTNAVVRGLFPTHLADGTPITYGGSQAASVYKDDSTTEDSGVALTIDYDGRTGLQKWKVDTSATPAFYTSGSDFFVVLTSGTVNGTTVNGFPVGAFSILNRSALRPTTAGRTLAVDGSGNVPVSVGTGTGQLDVTAGVVKGNMVQANGASTPSTSGRIAVQSVAQAVILSAADSPAMSSGTATAGSISSITLQSSPGADPVGGRIKLTSGLGAGQSRGVGAWNNGTLVLTPDYNWLTAPDNTTGYTVEYGNQPVIDSSRRVTVGSIGAGVIVGGSIGSGALNGKGDWLPASSFPPNFSVLAITTPGGAVTAGTVTDKTGYSLSQSFPANFAAFAIDTNGRVKSQAALQKNVAFAGFTFMMTDWVTHAPVLGKTVTCTRSIDRGAFATGTLTNVTEVGNGMYAVDFGTADLNGGNITLRATATGCDDTEITIYPTP